MAVEAKREPRAEGQTEDPFTWGRQTLVLADCLDWLKDAEHESIGAVVTDPP